jgi:hypothetical protein
MNPYVRLALIQKPGAISRDLRSSKENIMALARTAMSGGPTGLSQELDEMAGQIGRIQDRLLEIPGEVKNEGST